MPKFFGNAYGMLALVDMTGWTVRHNRPTVLTKQRYLFPVLRLDTLVRLVHSVHLEHSEHSEHLDLVLVGGPHLVLVLYMVDRLECLIVVIVVTVMVTI